MREEEAVLKTRLIEKVGKGAFRASLFGARLIFVTAFVVAKLASAQTTTPGNPYSRGGGSGKLPTCGLNGYETCAALTLFVDGTLGSDSNQCTAAGASACATIQGAINKIPKLIRHPVTVTVAANGSAVKTYTGAQISGFSFDPATAAAGAFLEIDGTLITATGLATGTATGTATAGSAGSGATFGTMTDGTQTWTANDLKGYILEITGGTGSGQTRMISSNTGTVITIVGTWATAPVAGSTYAIRDYGAQITTGINQSALSNSTAAASPAGLIIQGNNLTRMTVTTGGVFGLDRLKIAPSAAGSIGLDVNGNTFLYVSESRIVGSTTAVGLRTENMANARLQDVWIEAATGRAVFWGNPNNSATAGSLTMNRVEVTTTGSSGSVLSMAAPNFSAVSCLFYGQNSGDQSVIQLTQGASSNTLINNSQIQCTSGGSSVGLQAISDGSLSSGSVVASLSTSGTVTWTNCPTGVQATGGLSQLNLGTSSGTLTFTTGTTAISATSGGRIYLAVDPTTSGYTNDISIDGTTYTVAQFTALSPATLFNTSYGTWIGR